MRNFISGLIAVIIGSLVIVILLGLAQPAYPEPFNMIWFLLAGSSALQSTLFSTLTPTVVFLYIFSWIVIGFVIGPFSKPGWNTVRSALWVGLIHAVFALMSLLFLNPSFWDSVNRNLDLLSQFITSLILSLITLPSALPMALISSRIGRQAEPPVPTKIETICECGAVFKSKPLMCSECGKTLTNDD